ncbi:flagellum transition zone component, putative [Trypanosoma brucei gambiense DAL972]|uniref:Flagellum transition zone component, putative n=1 Tax=Trypanosoma brucei gambiense (strain MHOM/CI/86/DAL972) TaxID=679716 RepID=D0A3V3_TRYB9|nr:flagellum transition zone component, putative [Trypanosoma brucei gambiense DAL972]CBH15947.1 flagellum transition zone component, putative [Trypanosoma brucei gambiense DAL972]|eukprot:XP_011778211.1 flagellum transition zone component, putative [Trypanosoma brucei gambiense DAL972]
MQSGVGNITTPTSPQQLVVEAPAELLETCGVQYPAAADVNEGEVVDSKALSAAPGERDVSGCGPTLLSLLYSTQKKDEVGHRAVTPMLWECNGAQKRCHSSKRDFTTCVKARKSPPPGSATGSGTGAIRDFLRPYRESHSKRFRAKVVDCRAALSVDDQIITLKNENAKYKAQLLTKDVQLKELEAALRAFRAPRVPVPSGVTEPAEVGGCYNGTDTEVARLTRENGEVWRRLQQSHAQLAVWKRDARVSKLQELKMELAVYQAEVTRLVAEVPSSGGAGGAQNHPARSKLQREAETSRAKDLFIAELKERASENATALRKCMDDAMRTKSTLEQVREENELISKELCLFRKTALALTRVQEELRATQCELAEARERLQAFEQMMHTVGGPEEVKAVVKERDALLTLLKQHNAREAAYHREFFTRQREMKESMERCLQEAVQQERALAQDREMQLRRSCLMWKERCERLLPDKSFEQGRLIEGGGTVVGDEEQQTELHQLPKKIVTPFMDNSQRQRLLTKHIDDVLIVRQVSSTSAPASSSTTLSPVSGLSKLSITDTTQSQSSSHGMQVSHPGNEDASSPVKGNVMSSQKGSSGDAPVPPTERTDPDGGAVSYPASSAVISAERTSLVESSKGDIVTSISTEEGAVQLPRGLMTAGVDSSDDSGSELSDLAVGIEEGKTPSFRLHGNSDGQLIPEVVSRMPLTLRTVSSNGVAAVLTVASPPPRVSVPPAPVPRESAGSIASSENKLSDVNVAVPPPRVSVPPAPVPQESAGSIASSENKLSDVNVAVPPPRVSVPPAPVPRESAGSIASSENELSDVNVAVPPPRVSVPPAPVPQESAGSIASSENKLSDVNVAVPPPRVSVPPAPVPRESAGSIASSENKLSDVNVAVPPPRVSVPPAPVPRESAGSIASSENKLSDVNVAVPPPRVSVPPAPVPQESAGSIASSENELSDVNVAVPPPRVSVPPAPVP